MSAMDEFWICDRCRSLNRIKAPKCYACKTARGAAATPPPAAQSGAAPTAPAQTSYRPAVVPGPMPATGSPSQASFPQQPSFAQQPQPGPPQAAQAAPPVAWAPPTAAPKSNRKALTVIFGLAVFVVVAAGTIIAIAPGLTRSSSPTLVAAAGSATRVETPSPTPEPSPTATPTPASRPTPTTGPSLRIAPAPAGFQQLVSGTMGYALAFPSSWVYVSEDDPRTVINQITTLKASYPTLAELIDSETASLGPTYRVAMFDPANAVSRKAMAGLFAVTAPVPAQSLSAAAVKSELNAFGTISDLIVATIKEPAGPGIKATATMTTSGAAVKVALYLINAKRHAYVVVFVASTVSFSTYMTTFDQTVAAIQEPAVPG